MCRQSRYKQGWQPQRLGYPVACRFAQFRVARLKLRHCRLRHPHALGNQRLRFHEKRGTVTTIKVSDEMNINIAPDGTVYGIELLNANEQLAEDHGNLIIETSGSHRKIALAA